LNTLTERSLREVLAECGWISFQYEKFREANDQELALDRRQLLYRLCLEAGAFYKQTTGYELLPYQLQNIFKFAHRYAVFKGHLVPDLYKLLTAAKGCVDDHYAYSVWKIATAYPFYKNIDNLPALDLSVEQVWGSAQRIHFQLKEKARKAEEREIKRKQSKPFRFVPMDSFSICSYPPEDVVIERFGDVLKTKAQEVLRDEERNSVPFVTSLEEGIDLRRTLREWHQKKLYVKVHGKPRGKAGSLVVIFDEDLALEGSPYQEKYPWTCTWLGEHEQESDMAFYATFPSQKVIGPGISRCEYGGFFLSYPRGRLGGIWQDGDYRFCRSKAEVLLMAAIDYAVSDVIVYAAKRTPRSYFKQFASRFGKKVIYLPLGQFSQNFRNKVRYFHVLDGHDKRIIADDYIL
ncbi:MAG: hypothetical protein ACM3JI_04485, partial [Anaerolineae bacterium]